MMVIHRFILFSREREGEKERQKKREEREKEENESFRGKLNLLCSLAKY